MGKIHGWKTTTSYKHTIHVQHLTPVVKPDITHQLLLVHIVADEFKSDPILNPLLDWHFVQLAHFSHQLQDCRIAYTHIQAIYSAVDL